MVKKILRSWVFWIAVLIALLGAASIWLPILGIPIAALTVLGAVLQGYENQRTQEDINTKHAQAISQIQTTQNDFSIKHAEAMQEIAQAREEAATRHIVALREIDQARKEAALQYDEALQEIKRAKDEARAENILLKAEELAGSLMEKDTLANEAVALNPDLTQRVHRQLGIDMGRAVIGNVDYIKWQSMRAAGYALEEPPYELPLEEEERTFFIEHAISYLTETVLLPANPDTQGLLYLACMYGVRHQYDDMILVLDKSAKISPIVQTMRAEFRERPMMLILLGACGVDQTKIDRLRETLNLPETTEQFFCKYITQDYPLNPNYPQSEFIKWVAVKRPDAPGISGTFVISISPLYPSLEGTVYAFALTPEGRQEDLVPAQQDKRVSIEELYRVLTSLFILFSGAFAKCG